MLAIIINTVACPRLPGLSEIYTGVMLFVIAGNKEESYTMLLRYVIQYKFHTFWICELHKMKNVFFRRQEN